MASNFYIQSSFRMPFTLSINTHPKYISFGSICFNTISSNNLSAPCLMQKVSYYSIKWMESSERRFIVVTMKTQHVKVQKFSVSVCLKSVHKN